MAKRITVCAGIDTGKWKLDVAIDGSCEQLQVENTAEGHKVLLGWLRRHKVKRIGIEASGGFEQPGGGVVWGKGFLRGGFAAGQRGVHWKVLLEPAQKEDI